MLATPGPLPSGPQWAFEVKFDGIRLIADTRGGRTRLSSRNGRDLTAAFPELQALRDVTPGGAVLDGELIARTAAPPTLQALAPRIHRTRADRALQLASPVTYLIFDVMVVADRDVTHLPYTQRHQILDDLITGDPAWHVSEVFDDGPALWEATQQAAMEGVVAKRRDSRYRPGIRSKDWIKTVHRTTTDLVIIGWRPESGGRRRVGSLVVAEASVDGLRYAGSAGSGLTAQLSQALLAVLPALARSTPPIEVPAGLSPDTHWVDPVLVVSVTHLGVTTDGRLRQPTITALRPDLVAADLGADGSLGEGET